VLKKRSYLTPEELTGAQKVLKAAALTYLAAALAALMNLLRLILLSRRR
jgi:Zn-dependent membrane protease YugP